MWDWAARASEFKGLQGGLKVEGLGVLGVFKACPFVGVLRACPKP